MCPPLAAVVGFVALNWFFTPPVGRSPSPSRRTCWRCWCSSPSRPPVGTVVDRAARRAGRGRARPRRGRDAVRSGRPVLTGQDTATRCWSGCARRSARTSVSLLERTAPARPLSPQPVSARRRRATYGGDPPVRRWTTTDLLARCAAAPLRATDQRVLGGVRRPGRAWCSDQQRLAHEAVGRGPLAEADRTRTALLRGGRPRPPHTAGLGHGRRRRAAHPPTSPGQHEDRRRAVRPVDASLTSSSA